MPSDDLAFLNDVLNAQAASSNGNNAASTGNGGDDSSKVNGQDSTHAEARQAPSLASLQPILQALKISASSEEDLENMSDETISALLEKLDEASLVTDGLESRLDQLLGELDGMLENLEVVSAETVEEQIELSVQQVEEGRGAADDTGSFIMNGQIVDRKGES